MVRTVARFAVSGRRCSAQSPASCTRTAAPAKHHLPPRLPPLLSGSLFPYLPKSS
ncbi:MAG: hypothetical protein Q4A62_02420 [Eikenella sp.]|nr:hypothetical protein [Eikenella sp.]